MCHIWREDAAEACDYCGSGGHLMNLTKKTCKNSSKNRCSERLCKTKKCDFFTSEFAAFFKNAKDETMH
jgi:hypothetical protein